MDFEAVVQGRHSVRDFTSQDIPDELLDNIVGIAQRTPSWANSQPWKVYIAKGTTLDQIKRNHMTKAQQGAPSVTDMPQTSRSSWGRLPLANMQQWSDALSRFLQSDINTMGDVQTALFHAPALVYLTAEAEVSPWMVYDVGAFSQTLMLAAKDNGIDSIPAYEIVRYADDVHRIMGIPDNEMIICGIALGYASDNRINDFRTDRADTGRILTIRH